MSARRALPGQTLKLGRTYGVAVYSVGWGIWLTGLLWVVFHYFLKVKGRFGFKSNPLEEWWLISHGLFAVGATFLLGVLWRSHVVVGWDMRWRRRSGGWLAGTVIFLILTGAAIYYVGDPDWLNSVAIAHWAVGIAAIALFFVHWLSKSQPR